MALLFKAVDVSTQMLQISASSIPSSDKKARLKACSPKKKYKKKLLAKL